jgi:hypothetical protein
MRPIATNFKELEGKTIMKIGVDENDYDEINTIWFYCSDESRYEMYHEQECCEHVTVEEITGGDLGDLIGDEILLAEVTTNRDDCPGGSETYTFYRLKTIRTTVTIRWHGRSNGYYSEEVDFVMTKSPRPSNPTIWV